MEETQQSQIKRKYTKKTILNTNKDDILVENESIATEKPKRKYTKKNSDNTSDISSDTSTCTLTIPIPTQTSVSASTFNKKKSKSSNISISFVQQNHTINIIDQMELKQNFNMIDTMIHDLTKDISNITIDTINTFDTIDIKSPTHTHTHTYTPVQSPIIPPTPKLKKNKSIPTKIIGENKQLEPVQDIKYDKLYAYVYIDRKLVKKEYIADLQYLIRVLYKVVHEKIEYLEDSIEDTQIIGDVTYIYVNKCISEQKINDWNNKFFIIQYVPQQHIIKNILDNSENYKNLTFQHIYNAQTCIELDFRMIFEKLITFL